MASFSAMTVLEPGDNEPTVQLFAYGLILDGECAQPTYRSRWA